ncbi:MAG: helical backbone metal receptor [Anaerolineae bacterium]|nr:helical backbone metal receptor [Anaerolineae bacterium]
MNDLNLSDLTNLPEFDRPPQRVISLVPSMTESLFALGFGGSLIAVTDYCAHPAAQTAALPKIGGPKDPHIDEIIALAPDLVFANQEENTRQAVLTLAAAGLKIWLTFPQTVDQAMDILWKLPGIYHTDAAARAVKSLQMALDWAKASTFDQPKIKYFCPVWQDQTVSGETWWMTFNQDTYAHDLLQLFGGENVFAQRQRRYPLQADLDLTAPQQPAEAQLDTRYPRLSVSEIIQASPDLILLPDEPFAFDAVHKQIIYEQLSSTPAVKQDRIIFLDGSLITWHGVRIAKALQELPALFA